MADRPSHSNHFLFDFRQLTIVRGAHAILHGLDLQVRHGEHVAILGPNGSGKSSLIKAITRELYPLEGVPGFCFRIYGQDSWEVADLRSRLGIVSPDLLNQLTREVTAREMVLSGYFSSLGLWPHQRISAAQERRTRSILRFMEIAHLANRPLSAMSSGEQRRALIARALVHDPDALILDEPTNNLDPGAICELRTLMRKLAKAGHSLVLVTHHIADVIPEIERIVLIKGGRIVADGPKSKLLSSRRLSGLFGARLHVIRRRAFFDLVSA